MDSERKKHVLVLGCGRSGTSIFGELFKDTGAFYYLSEVSMDEIMNLDLSLPIALKVPRESELYPGDDGLSFPLMTLLEKLEENVQIFWIIRHPLDTICSLKVGISKNWGHHPRPTDWEEQMDKPLLEKCAYHWNYINTVSFNQVKHLAEIVYFEDMIANPRKFANFVFSKLSVVKPLISEWANRVQNANNNKFVEALTSRPYSTKDHTTRVGRWKENMSKDEARSTWRLIADVAERFSYSM